MHDVLQRAVHHLDDAEDHQEVDQHGRAAGGGVIAVLLLHAHQLFVLLFLVLGVLFLDLLDHRLVRSHAGGALLLLNLQREGQQAHDDREQDDGPAVVAHKLVDPLQHIAEGRAENA